MPQIVNLQITVKGILLVLLTLLSLWLLVAFDKILLILFLAILLAIAINPIVDRMEERKVPRALAIVIIYLFLLSVLSAVVGLLVPVLIDEFTQLSDNLPKITQSVLDFPKNWITPYFPTFSRSIAGVDVGKQLSGELGNIVGGVGGLLGQIARTLATVAISTFLILVVGFFLTSDARFAPRFIARFCPPRSRATVANLAQQIGRRLGHWVRAQLLVGLFFGVTFGLGLAVLGVPYALSLGVAGAVLELIPYLGGAIVTVIAMLVALAVSPWLPLGVLVLELVVANIESHVVYPKLVGDIVGLHPLTIIIALFIGAELKGIMGALLAVPVAVVLQVLFDHFYRFEDTVLAAEAAQEHEGARVYPAPELARES